MPFDLLELPRIYHVVHYALFWANSPLLLLMTEMSCGFLLQNFALVSMHTPLADE